MKPLIAFALLAASFLFTGCEAIVVDRGHAVVEHRRPAYRGGYYNRPYRRGYYDDDYYRRDRVVVRSGYPGRRVYYSDGRGRYYHNGGRRVYIRSW